MGVIVKEAKALSYALDEMHDTLEDVIQDRLLGYTFALLAQIQLRSPVAPGSGRYRAAWQVDDTVPEGAMAGAALTNNTEHAGPVTYGSPKGKKPWPTARELTVENGGRIYSKQAPDGVVEPILDETADSLAEEILEGIKI